MYMYHDPLCQVLHVAECDCSYGPDVSKYDIARKAVIDALRYVAAMGDPLDLSNRVSSRLTSYVDMVESQSPLSAFCPFCQEIECDERCPLHDARKERGDWVE